MLPNSFHPHAFQYRFCRDFPVLEIATFVTTQASFFFTTFEIAFRATFVTLVLKTGSLKKAVDIDLA